MNDQEVVERYYKSDQFNREFSAEDVVNPDFGYWGRARFWHFHQVVCLLAGMVPLENAYLSNIITSTSPIHYVIFCHYYPITPRQATLLKNISYLLSNAVELNEVLFQKGDSGEPLFKPAEIMQWANKLEGIEIPKVLVRVVRDLGPVKSLEIPDTFLDDSRPSIPEREKRIERNRMLPRSVNSVPSRPGFFVPDTEKDKSSMKADNLKKLEKPTGQNKEPKLSSNQIHKEQFITLAKKVVKENPKINFPTLKKHHLIAEFLSNNLSPKRDKNGNRKKYSDSGLKKWFREVKKGDPGRPKSKH